MKNLLLLGALSTLGSMQGIFNQKYDAQNQEKGIITSTDNEGVVTNLDFNGDDSEDYGLDDDDSFVQPNEEEEISTEIKAAIHKADEYA